MGEAGEDWGTGFSFVEVKGLEGFICGGLREDGVRWGFWGWWWGCAVDLLLRGLMVERRVGHKYLPESDAGIQQSDGMDAGEREPLLRHPETSSDSDERYRLSHRKTASPATSLSPSSSPTRVS